MELVPLSTPFGTMLDMAVWTMLAGHSSFLVIVARAKCLAFAASWLRGSHQ